MPARPHCPSRRTITSPERTTSGYSGTPLPKKLGVEEGHAVAYVHAPDDFEELMWPMPDGVKVSTRAAGVKDVIVVFARSEKDLRRRFDRAREALAHDGGLWVAYPKRAAKTDTDLDFGVVQAIGLEAGLVDNKSCAIDDFWSGVRFVYRLKDRPLPKR